jgi:hypothetical protein
MPTPNIKEIAADPSTFREMVFTLYRMTPERLDRLGTGLVRVAVQEAKTLRAK